MTGELSDPAGSPAPSPTDEDLIERIAARADRAAFAELFQRYSGRIKGFLMRGGLSDGAAEDAAQDVMVRIWQRAGSFDPARAGAATWIFTIARNRRIDLARRQARPEPDPEDPLFRPDPEPLPEQVVSGAERDATVREALSGLPEEQRTVVHLAFFAGLTHAEVAERLAVPLGTVKSRMRMAFGKLRTALGEDFSGELLDDG